MRGQQEPGSDVPRREAVSGLVPSLPQVITGQTRQAFVDLATLVKQAESVGELRMYYRVLVQAQQSIRRMFSTVEAEIDAKLGGLQQDGEE